MLGWADDMPLQIDTLQFKIETEICIDVRQLKMES